MVNIGIANGSRSGPDVQTYFRYDNLSSPFELFHTFLQPICLYVVRAPFPQHPASTFVRPFYFWKEKKHLAAICFSALSTLYISSVTFVLDPFCVTRAFTYALRYRQLKTRGEERSTRLWYRDFLKYRFAAGLIRLAQN